MIRECRVPAVLCLIAAVFTICTLPPTLSAGQCSDGIDNDGDGLIDWQYDQGCTGADDGTEGGIASGQIDNGWTVYEPDTDTRIIYVSSTDGNDAYDGRSPLTPKKTIRSAVALARGGHADWVLLKRGDIWFASLPVKSGRSMSAPFLVSSYGASTTRPLLKTGAKGGISMCCKSHRFIAVVGIAFYAHTRDFNSPEFTGQDGDAGLNVYVGDGYTGKGVLIEDCSFRFYKNNVVQGPGTIRDIILRRNLILDAYSHDSHSQGLYADNVSLLLEENIFDHNGWFKQQIGAGSEQDGGQATMFNHNTYFCNTRGVTFTGNMFLRPSSMGNKWTANEGEASAQDITIDNNLYVDGEIGIGIGGNETAPPHRFRNVAITRNVVLDIGLSRPTNRTLGWCLDINDWDIGMVADNLFLHQVSPAVTDVFAINLDGETRDVTISDNIVYAVRTNGELLILSDGAVKGNIAFNGNALQCPGLRSALIRSSGSLANYVFSGNTYFSARPAGQWFAVAGSRTGLGGWVRASGETGASSQQVSYPDPDRHIAAYQAHLGRTATIDAFIQEARRQSKYNWRKEYTAASVNTWIRAGFGIAGSDPVDRFDPSHRAADDMSLVGTTSDR
ncbi:MAG: hypothetical protein HYX75_12320 [Acidobacteria bacterium]|nr:hypothetical protein [Acidobacteriota bacterium]